MIQASLRICEWFKLQIFRINNSLIIISNPNNISKCWNSNSKQQQMKNSWKNDIKFYRNRMRFLSHWRKSKIQNVKVEHKTWEKILKKQKVQPVLIINSTGRITSMPSGIFPLIFQGPLTFPHPGKTKGHPSSLTPSPAPAISVSYHSVLNPMGDQPLVVLFSWEGIMLHIFVLRSGPIFSCCPQIFFLTRRHVSGDNKSTNYFRLLGKYTNSL